MKMGNAPFPLFPGAGNQSYFMVESCGEILLVRLMWERCYCRKLLRSYVFGADLAGMKWVKVENLGDQLLFLSLKSSISDLASEIGDKGNRIYYVPGGMDMDMTFAKEFYLREIEKSMMELQLGRDGMAIHLFPI